MSKATKQGKRRKPDSDITTDGVAISVYNNLLSDFRSVHPYFAPQALQPKLGLPSSYRELGLPDYRTTLTGRFKAYYQLDSLWKKYRFQDEQMTEAELERTTYDKYNAFQAKRSRYGIKPYTRKIRLVVMEARRICRDILGEFDWDEVKENCRFGRNSSVGCTFADSYLDYKLSANEALTGSVDADKFMRDYLLGDRVLAYLLKKRIVCLHEVLPLIIVPKKYDVGRTIMPLTLFGLFLSHGLGRVIEGRLALHPITKFHTLDIRKLQRLHRAWIRKYSITRTHATLDMSFGSENITSWLLNMLLPRKWYNALKMTFTRQTFQGEQQCYTESVLPMGNGATFPVETLVFYSLIRAIGNLLNVPGRYSVYGDDVIVPSGAYLAVLSVFEDLGIAVNRDKSFDRENFRESCGADFYNGAAVRPFYMPDGMKCSRITSPRYASWLYKCVNGLLARWSPEEIPLTLTTLMIELTLSTRGKVLVVPPSFPDGSGVKWADPTNSPLPGFQHWVLPRCHMTCGTRSYQFDFLVEVPAKRVVLTTACYYWDKLRASFQAMPDEPPVQLNELIDRSIPLSISFLDDVKTEWKGIVHKDCLRYLRYIGPSGLTYKSRVKTVTYKLKDGTLRKKKRVVWTAFISDKQVSKLEVKTAGRDPYLPLHEGQDPIITDWI